MTARNGSPALLRHCARRTRGLLSWVLLCLIAGLTLATVHAYEVEAHAEHPVCLSCVACTGLDVGTLPAALCLALAQAPVATSTLPGLTVPAQRGLTRPGARAPPASLR
jgi:hypothetical protein